MELLFPALAIFGAATYLTSLVCCFALWLGRKPRWYSVVVGGVGTGVLTWLFYRGGAGHSPPGIIPYACGVAATAGLMPSWFVVRYFRDRLGAGSRGSRLGGVIGIILGAVGAVGLVVGVTSWLKVPEDEAFVYGAVMRAVAWFLAGAGLSALGFYVGLREKKTDATA
jgi:hypothetical protein